MIKNVIFDLGAVLFEWNPEQIVASFTDSESERQLLFDHVLRHPDWLSLDRGTMLMAEAIPKFAARTGVSESRMEDFFEHIQSTLTIIPETELLIDQVQSCGYSAYFLTNMSSAFFEKLNEKHNLYGWFDGGLVSGKELMIKPEPDIFSNLVMRFAIAPEESLFIDDQSVNVEAAHALGFQVHQFEEPSESCTKIRNLLKIN
ncbi:HAD family phosphatase [Photobacterium sanctipauli]|uniref:HAD family phosphatase n=1 Tax=Photobacterium sanctipauli TaxID=1342794 RepID=A0A2T3NVE3_9GAMM|nr:HAD family phosphatase [Photobacterium sanctipauli]PSW20227.1 HAD family phosphatase [Photobacterium sanctipauli]